MLLKLFNLDLAHQYLCQSLQLDRSQEEHFEMLYYAHQIIKIYAVNIIIIFIIIKNKYYYNINIIIIIIIIIIIKGEKT